MRMRTFLYRSFPKRCCGQTLESLDSTRNSQRFHRNTFACSNLLSLTWSYLRYLSDWPWAAQLGSHYEEKSQATGPRVQARALTQWVALAWALVNAEGWNGGLGVRWVILHGEVQNRTWHTPWPVLVAWPSPLLFINIKHEGRQEMAFSYFTTNLGLWGALFRLFSSVFRNHLE